MDACPSCGQATLGDSATCGSCGSPLRAEPVATEATRLTVFFSDLKGSTNLGEKLDSEALREVLGRYFDAMTAELERHGGTIEKFIGDAIMAVFGLPDPRPDDALRAVRAAAATKGALALLNDELERTYGVRLVNRTGVATGPAAVGLARAGEHVLTGEAVQLASRLEQAAPASEILVARSTLDDVRAAGVEPRTEPPAPGTAAAELGAAVLVEVPSEREPVAVPIVADQLCPRCGEPNAAGSTACAGCGAALASGGESRRTVSIVFADLRATDGAGEALSPDALRSALSRGFEVASDALHRHGATVEKYVGDAVMAVFGLPLLHEDDALRAVRAAAAMRAAVETLSDELEPSGVRLTLRTGVNTGEVVAGDASIGQRLVTGDTVNTAARLEQAAPPHGILLGALTYALVRDAVETEPVEPLALKGKAERVAAYRLVRLRGTSAALPGSAGTVASAGPMLGRERELERLRRTFHESVVQNGPRLVTLVGDAGIGKSRLIRELERYVAGMAVVLRGRCLPYGEGITFWPVLEIVRSAAAIVDEDPPLVAQEKLEALAGDHQVATRIASILGLTALTFPMAELFWAVRRLCETIAARMPLVLVVDGVHWAAPAFVELIDYLLSTAAEAPILVVAAARHELLEAFPEWARNVRASLVTLEPLPDDLAAELLRRLLGGPGGSGADALSARILDVAQGNPLYLEQVVSMLADTGALRLEDGRWVPAADRDEVDVPPTIQALLAARVDAIPRSERRVLEPASVIGHSFAEPAVEALVEPALRPEVVPSLTSLSRRQLVRPDPAPASEPWYRFHNLLVRDAVYRALLKRSRVALHERFVGWADGVNRERGREREFEEISGYHLEQSYRYRRELGPLDATAVAVGRDAARRLTSTGHRAFARGDMAAAANLYGRAAAVLQPDDADRRSVLPELAEALMELGRFEQAFATLADAAGSAEAAADERLLTHAELVRLLLEVYTGEGAEWSARALRRARSAVATFEALDDNRGLTRAWRVQFGVHASACRYEAAADAAEHVVRHATLAGDRRQEARGATGYAQVALLGPTPVPEAVERCRELLVRTEGDRRSEAMILLAISELEGMAGSFDAARERAAAARAMLAELGAGVALHSTSINSWRALALAGDLAAAERELRRDYDALGRMGERYVRSTIAGLLGHVLLAAGQADEAELLAQASRELADAEDLGTQALWRSLAAKLEVRGGGVETAIALAREALDVLGANDSPTLRADALADLAEVYEVAGRWREACDALLAAIALYEGKGAAAPATRMRARLDAGGSLSPVGV